MTVKPALPLPWYYSLDELAHEWNCTVDRVLYYLDAGLLTPCALVAKPRLPPELRAGVAPYLCIILDRYRAMEWQHRKGNATVLLAGECVAFYVDGEGFRNVHFTLPEPVAITKDDLVISLDQREHLEGIAKPTRRRRGVNSIERRNLLYIIRALAAMHDEALQPYKTAGRVCERAAALGIELSRETVARKLKEAAALPVMLNVGSIQSVSIAPIAEGRDKLSNVTMQSEPSAPLQAAPIRVRNSSSGRP